MLYSKPKVIAIAGPNGAGKTTLAPFLIRDEYGLIEYVNADTIALGLTAFNPESVAFEAGRIMLKRLRSLAGQEADFAFETTLATRSYAGWIKALQRRNYEFHLIYLWLRTVELAIERVHERVRGGGHDVPDEVVRRRYAKGVRNFFDLYQGLADTWGIYDNSSPGNPARIAIKNKDSHDEILQWDLWEQFCEVAKWV